MIARTTQPSAASMAWMTTWVEHHVQQQLTRNEADARRELDTALSNVSGAEGSRRQIAQLEVRAATHQYLEALTELMLGRTRH